MASSPALDWLDSLQGSGIRPGLGRIRALLRKLGNPHRAYPSIIVAGTNGKGSTCATLNSILLASGYGSGMYTSPHLVDIRERWMIDGKPIDPTLFEESIEALHRAADSIAITPTYFEALTVLAFIAFERARCEVVVLEVGMGGRLDATNVVRPIAALITPIGLDHTEYLGNTVRKIAAEKAGVIHRGAIVLTSNTDPVVLSVIEKRAARFGCVLHVIRGNEARDLPLNGEFQRANISLAMRAAQELRGRLPKITAESIAKGIAATRWRGRLERMRVAGKDIWVDGCHNLHAARAIAPFVESDLPRPRLLVFGIMSDKDVNGVTSLLFPMFDEIIATDPYAPRSEPPENLVRAATDLGVRATAVPDVGDAIRRAIESDERTILIAGSLYLAGAAIAALDKARQQEK
ncbi:MAG TPA: folylpolyglutamate synthase/dihydrofolate synthase family protein [Thermoanaerobaculia bacterium]|nr:folylpolyglutamate synthase/dihydrofolate synthase family protein [Thermoanaerobaculia bacterium]